MEIAFMTGKSTIFSSLLIGSLLISSCAASEVMQATLTPASPSSELDEAQAVLLAYFDDLYTGKYDAAADLFGGDLSMLVDSNPAVDPSDIAALLEAACTYQLRCLPVKAIVDARQVGESLYDFELEFSNPDGSLFVLGPCCGASETEMPPVSQFDCSVEESNEGDYRVMCLPVYVP
jgi:hypothetical protein